MDKPDFKIRRKVTMRSISRIDSAGNKLEAAHEQTRNLDAQDYVDEIRVELIRPESKEANRLKISRRFSRSEAELFLAASNKLVQLMQRRKHMIDVPPEQGMEFSIDAFGDVIVGAFDSQDKEPSYFVEFSKEEDAIRFPFETIKEFDSLRHILGSGR